MALPYYMAGTTIVLMSPKIQETSLKISRTIDPDHDQIWTNHLHFKIEIEERRRQPTKTEHPVLLMGFNY